MNNQRILTKVMLDAMEKRIAEIEATIEKCNPYFDADVIARLDQELSAICESLTESMTASQNARRPQLKVV